MDKYQETFETWNKIAKIYEDKFMDMDLYNESYDFICQNINTENAKLLEIGCGPGNIAKYLLSKRPDFKILGIDVAPKMIELAQKNNPTAHFEVMDARAINNLNDHFDGVIAGFYLPYLSVAECNEFISKSSQLLNDRGLIYLSFVEGDPKASEFKTNHEGDRVYFQYHELSEIETQLKAHGFGDIHVSKVAFKKPDIHTIVIARKKSNTV
ncbi:class I SAM-dependent DNA methyltransferase [Pedobacter chitinilyticus]|uniref:Class I SAM-dependent methyltransferase n=1 Tax=Pedobacter chitinilyticus TaxID=2233776 RepID=A0A3S3PF71_9SPHI|nr:class I SAM-dependent methyltransferase [Pedobacter chitinilyticus]RWU03921.1 class I SAM-dependent methyltransferase [Pedobacter chitinilyticus]